MYKTILTKATTNQELSESEIFQLINSINNDEVSAVQIAAFQVALLMKGTSMKEMAFFAKAMRENCVPINPRVDQDLMDTCGTGGGLSTFNISTATALVAAAAGILLPSTILGFVTEYPLPVPWKSEPRRICF